MTMLLLAVTELILLVIVSSIRLLHYLKLSMGNIGMALNLLFPKDKSSVVDLPCEALLIRGCNVCFFCFFFSILFNYLMK